MIASPFGAAAACTSARCSGDDYNLLAECGQPLAPVGEWPHADSDMLVDAHMFGQISRIKPNRILEE